VHFTQTARAEEVLQSFIPSVPAQIVANWANFFVLVLVVVVVLDLVLAGG
jgi:hypothetical protein